MTILTTLANQKHHIIYGSIILAVASVGYHFFKKEPEIITKTLTKVVTQIQTVEKVVTKDKIVYVDRTIVTKKANGDTITETDHEHDETKVHKDITSQTQTQTKITEKTVENFMKNYSIEAFFPASFSNLTPNPLDTQLMLGVRVFDLPFFVEVGTNLHLNQALIGLRMEF